jgi:hypothetical protein
VYDNNYAINSGDDEQVFSAMDIRVAPLNTIVASDRFAVAFCFANDVDLIWFLKFDVLLTPDTSIDDSLLDWYDKAIISF